ncbi:MAG TPA: hypothetical protein DDZ68_13975 [Parvularcula sp.]|nr:hypothetical protein [Parvularcula sp.]
MSRIRIAAKRRQAVFSFGEPSLSPRHAGDGENKKRREEMAKMTTFALTLIVTLAAIFPAAYTMGMLA